jgi:hypothetical protein
MADTVEDLAGKVQRVIAERNSAGPLPREALPVNFLAAINDLKSSTNTFSETIKFFAIAAKDIQDRSNRYNKLIDSTIALQESSKAQNTRLIQSVQTLQGKTLEVISQSTLRSLNTIIDKNNKFILDQDKKRAAEYKFLEPLLKQQKPSAATPQSTGNSKVKDWFFNSTVEGDFIKSMMDAFKKKPDTNSTDTDSDEDTETAAEALRIPALQPVKVMEYGDEALRQLCKLFKNCINLKPEKKAENDCVELCDPCPDCSSKLPNMLPALMKVAAPVAAAAAVTAAVAVAAANKKTATETATEQNVATNEVQKTEEQRVNAENQKQKVKTSDTDITEPFVPEEAVSPNEFPGRYSKEEVIRVMPNDIPNITAPVPVTTPAPTTAPVPVTTPAPTLVPTGPEKIPEREPDIKYNPNLPGILRPTGPTVSPGIPAKPFLTPAQEPFTPYRTSPSRTPARGVPVAIARPANAIVSQGSEFANPNVPKSFDTGSGYVDTDVYTRQDGGGGRNSGGGRGGRGSGGSSGGSGGGSESGGVPFENEGNWRGTGEKSSPDNTRFQDNKLYPTAEAALAGQPPPPTLGQIGSKFAKDAASGFTPSGIKDAVKETFNPTGGYIMSNEQYAKIQAENNAFRTNNLAKNDGAWWAKAANAEYAKPAPDGKVATLANKGARGIATATRLAAPLATAGVIAAFVYQHAQIDQDLNSGKIDMLEARKRHIVVDASAAAAAAGGMLGATAAGFLAGLITLPVGMSVVGIPVAAAAEGAAILAGGAAGGMIAESLVSGATRKWVDANLKEEDQKVETGKPMFERTKPYKLGSNFSPPQKEQVSDYSEPVTYTKDQYGRTVVIPKELAGPDKKKERDAFIQKSVELFNTKASKNPNLYKNATGAKEFNIYNPNDPNNPIRAYSPGALDYRNEIKNENINAVPPETLPLSVPAATNAENKEDTKKLTNSIDKLTETIAANQSGGDTNVGSSNITNVSNNNSSNGDTSTRDYIYLDRNKTRRDNSYREVLV